ncbi:hypothetical protein [Nocardioides gilvus]|uniref:hypothetical protein n=1 Tax=Nocardioides gilvus TaxID=1735589 RepID=UPI000D74171E|nr:hypothetical protein [Nocardioides gilvus]
MSETPWIEARTIGIEEVRDTFALAARHLLADVAADYHAVISVADLAVALQEKTLIRQRQAPSQWMGDVLFRVAKDCRRRNEPLLGALVVGPHGRMSDWYADTVSEVRGDEVLDPEMHAAEERLECYRLHGADLPEGGGVAALPPTREPARRAARTTGATAGSQSGTRAPRTSTRAPAAPKPPATPKYVPPAEQVCPRCFMVLAAGHKTCDNCD